MSRLRRPSPVPRTRSGGLRGLAASVLAVVLLGMGGLAPAYAETTGPLLDQAFSARVGEGFGPREPAGQGRNRVSVVVPMADGGFLVGGSFSTYQGQPAPGLARLTPDLELDAVFMERLGSGFTGGGVRAVVPMPDGSLVVGLDITTGYQGRSLYGLARLTPDLRLDEAFEADLGVGIRYLGSVRDVLPMPGGGFVLGGDFIEFQRVPTPGLVRVDDRLRVDPDFAAALGAGFTGGNVWSVAALPDGGWLVGGGFAAFRGQPARYLARITPQLELAVEDAPAAVNGTVTEVAALPDGGALVAGQFTQYDGQSVGSAIRLDSRMRFAAGVPFSSEGRPSIETMLSMSDGGYLFGGGAFATVDGQAAPGFERFVAATVALAPVADLSGYAGLPSADLHLTATRAPTWLPEVTYSATGLPAGVTVDTATGRITGTPTTPGTYAVELSAHLDSLTDVTTATWRVLPSAAPQLIGEPTGAVVGTPFRFQPEVAGAPAPTVTVGEGALPPGLTLDPGTGLVSGTPTTPGTYRFTLVATNGIGPDATVLEVRIDVLGPPRVAVDRPEVVAGQEQSVTGSGFAPGEPVAVEMASDPVDLGAVTADAAGEIALTFTVPAATSPGAHTVTATGRGGAGVATFVVVEEAVVEEAVAELPADEPDDALAVTGAAVGPVVGTVAALLGVGLVLALGAGSVRRRAAEG